MDVWANQDDGPYQHDPKSSCWLEFTGLPSQQWQVKELMLLVVKYGRDERVFHAPQNREAIPWQWPS